MNKNIGEEITTIPNIAIAYHHPSARISQLIPKTLCLETKLNKIELKRYPKKTSAIFLRSKTIDLGERVLFLIENKSEPASSGQAKKSDSLVI